MSDWTFFSNYGHLIFLLGTQKNLTVREMAIQVGITERAVLRILGDLEKAGYVEISKQGRKNEYKVNRSKYLKHEIEKQCSIGDLIDLIGPKLK
tara:strand:+ start:5443 stop:5724 length:282 start_codon:yes stop_codon:yes gene_type:complete